MPERSLWTKSLWTKVALCTLVLAVSFTLVTGASTSPVYARHWSGGGYWGGGSYWRSYSWYYPYYSYSYYPYYSTYYCGYGYYTSCASPYYYGAYSNYYNGGYSSYSSAQYTLTVNTNPSSLSGQVTGGGSYSYGSTASFSVSQTTVQTAPDTRYVFQGWSGGYSGSGTSGSVTMTSSVTVTAIFQPQYLLSLSAQPAGAPTPQGNGWFNAGDTASVSIPSQTVSQNPGSQLVFNGWSVDGSSNQAGSTLSLQMNAPHSVIAQYKQQYYLSVQSDQSQGVVSGQGCYDAGSNVPISVTTPPSPMFGVNYVFNGWQGSTQSSSQSTTVLMNGPMTVTATWHQDYTVLYITIGAIIAVIAVAAIALIHTTKNRKQTTIIQQQIPQQQTQQNQQN